MAPKKTEKNDLSWNHIICFRQARIKMLTLRSPDVKSQLTGKDPDAGKNWGQEKKGVTEAEMAGRHHGLSGHESEPTPGDSEGTPGVLRSTGSQRVRHNLGLNNSNNNGVWVYTALKGSGNISGNKTRMSVLSNSVKKQIKSGKDMDR